MLRHATILVLAVLVALATAQGLQVVTSTRAAASPAGAAPVAAQAESAPRLLDAEPEATAAEVSKSPDGHYWAQANVNGRWIKFLVDTGASDVALTQTDAQRLGVDVANLDYARPVVTANGQTKAANITLDQVTVAGARIDGVEALVVKDGLSTSLLGMSYLGRLSRFEATKTALILRP